MDNGPSPSPNLASAYAKAKSNYAEAKRTSRSAAAEPRSVTNHQSSTANSSSARSRPSDVTNRLSSTANSSRPTRPSPAAPAVAAVPSSQSGLLNNASNTIQLPSHVRARMITAALDRLELKRPKVLNHSFTTPSSVLNDIEDHLIVETRVAGLRKGRETSILSLIGKLKATRLSTESAQEDLLQAWTKHADELAIAAYRKLDASDRRLKGAIIAHEDAVKSKEKAAAEAKSARQHIQVVRDEAELKLHSVRKKMRLEAEEAANAVAAKHQKELQELQYLLESNQNASTDKQRRLEADLLNAKAAAEQLKEKICQISEEKGKYVAKQEEIVSSLTAKLQSTQSVDDEKICEVENLRGEVKELKCRLQDETEQLNTVEEKVKRILAAKDKKIASLLKRAKAAEDHIRALEKDFSEE